jgi:hypothetical protein
VHYTPHLSRQALATAGGDTQIPDDEAAKLGVWRDPRSLHHPYGMRAYCFTTCRHAAVTRGWS